jgi:23S rRNA (cytosine1962-C5)-methyltransferase
MQARGPARAMRNGTPFTDTIRLIHGEADGLPGIAVDRLGPILRMIVTSEGAAMALADRVAGQLLDHWSGAGEAPYGLIEVLHLRDEGAGRHECVRWWRPPRDDGSGGALLDARGRLIVHEGGLAYSVDPGLGEPERPRPGVGLYLDQRDNRHRLVRFARGGGRWLNLFAHTGAFSVALLAAGAGEVVSVDLSKRYLEWLDENLALNRDIGVDASHHRAVRMDGRRYLDELPRGERFAGIVLDPPTAAAAGRRYWSTESDLAPLVEQALLRLEPGGVLLVARNHRRARRDLVDLVRAAAKARGVELAGTEAADPGPDFPRLRGFREGDSFRGVLAIRD